MTATSLRGKSGYVVMLALIVLLFALTTAMAAARDFTVVNNTALVIEEFEVLAPGRDGKEIARLPAPLGTGASGRISIAAPGCRFTLRGRFEDGSGVGPISRDICRNPRLRLVERRAE